MPRCRSNYRKVKLHRCYTVEEVASLLETHKNTVRKWVKDGLQTNDDKRPMLILGSDLATYLKARWAKKKCPCKPDEFYCLRCHHPRVAAGRMADCQQINEKIGHLTAICSVCYCMMNRRVNLANLDAIREQLAVTFKKGQEQVSNRTEPNQNSDFKNGA